MTEFEYVMVLTSLILGLGISQLLVGISGMIRKFRKVRIYLPHLICVIVIFGIHVQEWWVNFEYSRVVMTWKFSVFTFVISYPIILYIMARLLFPLNFKGKVIDLKEFYLTHYQKFFFFGFLMAILSIPQNIILLEMRWDSQFVQFLLSLLLLLPVFWRTRNNWFHYGVVSLMVVFGVFYVVLINPTL